jgi:hypothetical protein
MDGDQEWRVAEVGGLAVRHLLTVDRNLSFQQNLVGQALAVVVLRARTNRLADLLPLVPEVLSRLPGAQLGAVTTISEPIS